ncbi:unnamed protein product [Rhizophagus irregularis]|uniref:Uncharacterized protein n=1 Tax=Rhizophagus irregularis TaxID=588596 RepID=A0A916EEP2_9GLOM|nr:unnamed protein product [Rhizophagus irregularis]
MVKNQKALFHNHGSFKEALNYSLDDDDENNLNDLILFYIAKRVEEREARYKSTTTNEIQPSNNIIKSKDGCVYNFMHNKVGSTSTSQQINIGCEENEINGRRCRLYHKTGHYALKCSNKENTIVNG